MSFLRRLLDLDSSIGFQHHDIGIIAGIAVARGCLAAGSPGVPEDFG